MDTLSAVFRYLNAGYSVIPIWRDRRKNPHLTSFKAYHERLPTYVEWRRWLSRWPNANIGLITGYWGMVALDFDDAESYRCWSESVGEICRQTWTVSTRRGYHVWFALSDCGRSRNYVCRCGQHHEVLLRAKGGYCIVPPSVHHSGVTYRTVHKVPVMIVENAQQLFEDRWIEKQKRQAPGPLSTRPPLSVRIEEIIEPIGTPNGRGAFKAFCPFHDDNKPSAWVNPDQQRFGCNACWPGLWWDAINVYAMLKGISNGEAFKEMRQ